MPAIQFGCPYCTAVSQIDAAMAGQQVQCPACQEPLVVPGELDLTNAPTSAQGTIGEPGTNERAGQVWAAPLPAGSDDAGLNAVAPPRVRRLTPAERSQRRFHRNLIMATLGVALLVVVVAILVRLSDK